MVESEFRQRLIDRALSNVSATGASTTSRGSLRDYYQQKKVVNKLSMKLQVNDQKSNGEATKHNRSPSSVTTATETDESYSSSAKLASPSNNSAFTPISTREAGTPLTPVSASRHINLEGSADQTKSPAVTDASGSALHGLEFAYLTPQVVAASERETRDSIPNTSKVNYFQPIVGGADSEVEVPPPPPPIVNPSYEEPLKDAKKEDANKTSETTKSQRRSKKPARRGRSRTRRSVDYEDEFSMDSFRTIEDSEFGYEKHEDVDSYYDDGYDDMSQGTFLGALLCGSFCGSTDDATCQRSKSKSRSHPSKSQTSRNQSRSLSGNKLADAYLDMLERTLQIQESRTRSYTEESYDASYSKYALNDSVETDLTERTNNTSAVENSFDASKADLVAVLQGKVRRKAMDQSTPNSKPDIKQLV